MDIAQAVNNCLNGTNGHLTEALLLLVILSGGRLLGLRKIHIIAAAGIIVMGPLLVSFFVPIC